ncbi:MAG: hypothetical protein FWC85_02595 [Elusimicrobia bacterium]|nr:hypothetical protein [Elusimicrobiota bacterium]
MTKVYLFFYNLLFTFLLAPAALFLFIVRRDFFCHFKERLGFYNFLKNKTQEPVIWVHCSSLGEVKAVESTIKGLPEGYSVFLSVFTKTARDWAKTELLEKGIVKHLAFAPLDLYPLLVRVVKKLNIKMLILVETEIWPSMIYACASRGAKIVTVNGRLSKNSFKYYNATKYFWRKFVSLINIVLARTPQDAERFTEITSHAKSVRVTGNIKYDLEIPSQKSTRDELGFKNSDIIFVCGSTREGEEVFIKNAYIGISKKYPQIKFVVAPRHIKRAKKVCGIFKAAGINVSLYSRGISPDITVVDVFGKLQALYNIADICFVGGSLVNKGGQNPIEPAAYAKPVLFGDDMCNFALEAESLLEHGGGFLVENASKMTQVLGELISNPAQRLSAGQQALQAVNAQRGATAQNLQIIKEFLN